MRNRIRNAFEGVVLNERRKEEILSDVLDGTMKEGNMKENQMNFWSGKFGGAVVVAAAVLVFVAVNLVMFAGRGKGTPASEMNSVEPVTEEMTELQNTMDTQENTIADIEATEQEAKRITEFITAEKVGKIQIHNGKAGYTRSDVSTPEAELFDLLQIYEEIPGGKDNFHAGQGPNVYGEDAPLYCITFFYDTGNDIVSKMEVKSEVEKQFDELNIISTTEISINGVHYRAEAEDFLQNLKEFEDGSKFGIKQSIPSEAETPELTVEAPSSGATGSTGGLPVKGGEITSAYGERWGIFHEGIDYTSDDLNIYLPMDGTVLLTGYVREKGNYVVMDHGNGVTSEYHHLESIAVAEGDKLSEGTVLGIMGNTGNSTGTHLHWEICVNGEAVNPEEYIGRQN